MTADVCEPVVTVALDPGWAVAGLVDDVRRGFAQIPRSLSPKWLYDDRGSLLFDAITRLPEYYPTEREREILTARATEIARTSGATTVVELGSGTSDKTRTLLDAFAGTGQLERFIPVDVSEGILRQAAADISREYAGVVVHAVVGDFTQHLEILPAEGRRIVVFLGGTIGNLDPHERAQFLRSLSATLDPGESLLLGTDLVKDLDRMVAAYDDPQGITAEFVRNSLHVVNRELDADFDVESFSYVPFWDPREERMDLRLRAEKPQHVCIPGADLEIDLAAGEEIRIELSSKFRLEGIRSELAAVGLDVVESWTDDAGDFALTLAVRTGVPTPR
jgi:L-histidine N-alpha-methyltransferase